MRDEKSRKGRSKKSRGFKESWWLKSHDGWKSMTERERHKGNTSQHIEVTFKNYRKGLPSVSNHAKFNAL